MLALHRHQLAHLTDAGWLGVRAQAWDDTARACIDHWARHRLPLVVTHQPTSDDGMLSLGLSAPLRWQLRRLTIRVNRSDIAGLDEFPHVQQVQGLLPAAARPAWRDLCEALASIGASARVYGSHGWQRITGLPYLRASSDIDLWLSVHETAQADVAVRLLDRFSRQLPRRLDGELQFADGCAYAWREWQTWRSGQCRAILCKTLQGVSLNWAMQGREALQDDVLGLVQP